MENLNNIQEIVNINDSIWSKLYPNINQIIDELDQIIAKEVLSVEIKNKIFWFFRNYLMKVIIF